MSDISFAVCNKTTIYYNEHDIGLLVNLGSQILPSSSGVFLVIVVVYSLCNELFIFYNLFYRGTSGGDVSSVTKQTESLSLDTKRYDFFTNIFSHH